MEVIKQLKIIVGDIQLEDPSGKVHCDLANDDTDVEKIKSEIERVIHELLFPRAAKGNFVFLLVSFNHIRRISHD